MFTLMHLVLLFGLRRADILPDDFTNLDYTLFEFFHYLIWKLKCFTRSQKFHETLHHTVKNIHNILHRCSLVIKRPCINLVNLRSERKIILRSIKKSVFHLNYTRYEKNYHTKVFSTSRSTNLNCNIFP